MAGLTTNMKIAIGTLLLLGIPMNFFHLFDVMISAEITALTIVFAMLIWKRSRWGLIGSVVLVILGVMTFSLWNIFDILTGAIETPQIWLCTEPLSLALGILFLIFVFKAYRE